MRVLYSDPSGGSDLLNRINLEPDFADSVGVGSGMEAWQTLQRDPNFDILLLAWPLPDVQEAQISLFLGELKKHQPKLAVVFTSDGLSQAIAQSVNAKLIPRYPIDQAVAALIACFRLPPQQASPWTNGTSAPAAAPWEQTSSVAPSPWETPAPPVAAPPASQPWGQPSTYTGAPALMPTTPSVEPPPSNSWMPGAGFGDYPGGGSTQTFPEASGIGAVRTIRLVTAAIHSPKGGAGKTTASKEIATMFSLVQMHGKPLRVLLIDADVEFADIAMIFRIQSAIPNIMTWQEHIRARLRTDPSGAFRYTAEQIQSFLLPAPHHPNLKLLLGPKNHTDGIEVDKLAMDIIIDSVKQSGAFDIILIDTGPNTGDATMAALTKADIVLYLTTQDYTSINDCYNELNTLRSFQFSMDRFRLVINKARTGGNVYSPDDIAKSLRLPILGVLPDVNEKVMQQVNNNGEAMVEKENEYTEAMRSLLNGVLPVFNKMVSGKNSKKTPAADTKKKQGPLTKLFRRG